MVGWASVRECHPKLASRIVLMDADTALLRVWNLGEAEGGRSDALTAEAERLLPILLKADYAKQLSAEEARIAGTDWTFTQKGALRAMELERAGRGT